MRGADRRAVRALVDGELSAAAEADLRARAAADSALGAYLDQMERLRESLGTLPPSASGPRPMRPPTAQASRRWLAPVRLAIVAAVVLIGAFAISMVTRSTPPSPQVEVQFSLVAPHAQSVEIAGDFSGWQPVPLERHGETWEGELALWPGRYAYMYRVDGQWTTDPRAHSFRDDEYGRRNAVLHL